MYCFILMGIAIILQLNPYTGIFLMILGGPFWSVILINLGFLLMAQDALRSPKNRWLIIFPASWFVGYLAVSATSHYLAMRHNSDLVAFNASKHLRWDKGQTDVFVDRNQQEMLGRSLTAAELTGGYNLDVAFDREFAGAPVQSVRLLEDNCPEDRVQDGKQFSPIIERSANGWAGSRAEGLCWLFEAAEPTRSAIRIGPGPMQVRESLMLTTMEQMIEIRPPNGQALVVKAGWAQPLSWFPQPIIGCALNSGAPAWQCMAGFSKESRYSAKEDRTPNDEMKVVAEVLSLKKIGLRERFAVPWTNLGR